MQKPVAETSPEELSSAAKVIFKGGLVAFPTETVYGLGADAENPEAVARIYQVKNRPSDHPVIVHISKIEDVLFWARSTPDYANSLMRDYWPGPMTLILPRSQKAKDFVTGGQDSVGLRIPDHQVALQLIQGFQRLGGHGVAAPSANRYGAVSPTSAAAVEIELRKYMNSTDLIIEGGPCEVGVESTIIDCTKSKPIILRPGAVTLEMIQASTGIAMSDLVTDSKTEALAKSGAENLTSTLRVSGSHKQHYSPRAKVLLGGIATAGEGLIALIDVSTPAGAIRLSEPKTLADYARELYAGLRKADELGLDVVRVIQPTGDGLAIALRDRISRSAAKK